MRFLLFLTHIAIIVMISGSMVLGQTREYSAGGYHAQATPPHMVKPAAYRHHACDSPVCCDSVCPPSAPPQQSPPAAPPSGYYAAPPQAGTTAGPTSTYGIDGFALHLPALTLRLPSLQLPSLVKFRRGPRMMLDQAEAPYVEPTPTMQGAPLAIQTLPAQQQQPSSDVPAQSPPGCDAPRQAPTCGHNDPSMDPPPRPTTSWNGELEQRLLAREREIETLQLQLRQLTQSLETITRHVQRSQASRAEPSQPNHSSRRLPPQGRVEYETTRGRRTMDANVAPAQYHGATEQPRRLPHLHASGDVRQIHRYSVGN